MFKEINDDGHTDKQKLPMKNKIYGDGPDRHWGWHAMKNKIKHKLPMKNKIYGDRTVIGDGMLSIPNISCQ